MGPAAPPWPEQEAQTLGSLSRRAGARTAGLPAATDKRGFLTCPQGPSGVAGPRPPAGCDRQREEGGPRLWERDAGPARPELWPLGACL